MTRTTYDDLNNRFSYHPPVDDIQIAFYEEVRRRGREFAIWIYVNVPDSREREIAIQHVEESVFWINAGYARH